jgi:hypothetical protein
LLLLTLPLNILIGKLGYRKGIAKMLQHRL